MDVKLNPRPLETHVDWTRDDVQDESKWTVELTDADKRELDHALARRQVAFDESARHRRWRNFRSTGSATKLEGIERELIDGRGFVRIRTLDTKQYSDDDLTMLYWGIGMHLGDPWPQNHYGHVMGDVTDQGKRLDDPTVRGNEIGQVGARLSHRRRRPHRADVPAQGQVGRAFLRRQRRRDLQRAGADAPRSRRGALRAAALRRARRAGAGRTSPTTCSRSSPSTRTGSSSASSRSTSCASQTPSRCAAPVADRARGARRP